MRFSVRCLDVRAGEEKRTLRKSAFCADALTEKRILRRRPHGKAHSAQTPSRKSAFCVRDVTKKYILDGRRDHGDATKRRTLRNPTPSTRGEQPTGEQPTTKTKVGAAAHKAGTAAQVTPPSRPAPRRPVPYALAQHAQQPVDVRGGPHLLDDRLVLKRLGDVCEYL